MSNLLSSKSGEMKKRKNKLRALCGVNFTLEQYSFNFSQVTERYYIDKKAKLSYCKVPKAGSSLWTQIFMILRTEPQQNSYMINKIVEESRNKLHGYKPFFSSMPTVGNSTSSVIMSRNPYSRLFSAYIDKIYLMDKFKISRIISMQNGKPKSVCGYNVTFQEFLDYVVSQASNGYNINRHWAPVYLLCRPCDVRYDVISKIETLTEDLHFIFNHSQVSRSTKDIILNVTKYKADLFGVLNTYLSHWNKHRVECPILKEYLLKIWTALKYQGELKHDLPFPTNAFSSVLTKNPDMKVIVNDFVEYVTKNRPTSEERRAQRRRALTEAYKGIRKSTIDRVQKLYQLDFLLFQYELTPPL
ncbi:carbohydrate sulfotransferase 9-like [Saccostrea echinata]|uniref:carbohydrate sulfotransferase 9-like n=1 Tax=Saccostrea echinata TaxID=191078 RepID=UPI002A83F680|nr:carbohydrate sulfotransferase 9-like [Saccostrea echinata]